MVSENVNSSESLGSYLAFPALTTGFGALTAVRRNDGIGNAIKEVQELKKYGINDALKQTNKDIFSRSIKAADNYEAYKSAAKNAHKWAKKAAHVEKKGSIGLVDTAKNFFKSEKTTTESILKNSKDATANLNSIKSDLKNGIDVAAKNSAKEAAKDTAKAALKTGEQVAKSASKTGFMSTAGKLFKSEISSPFTIALTAAFSLPELFEKVIPKFKNEGAKEGLKETGKWGVKVGADLLSFAAGGAIGRTVGAAIGNLICPFVGAGVGGAIGSMIGSMFLGSKTSKVVEKITGEDTNQQAQEEQAPETSEQAQKLDVAEQSQKHENLMKARQEASMGTGANLKLSA